MRAEKSELMEQEDSSRQDYGRVLPLEESNYQENFTISKSAVKRRKCKPTGVVILTYI